MSLVLHGMAVGRGIAIGRVHVLQQVMGQVRCVPIEEQHVEYEQAAFRAAIAATRQDLELLRQKIPAKAPSELSAFLSVHQMLLADPMLVDEPLNLIKEHQCNAAWALKMQVDMVLSQFDMIQDPYLKERRQDIWQVAERILQHLHGQDIVAQRFDFKEETILVAHDLSPADMIIFKESNCAGFATDVGGVSSHTAILARSLDIPSVIALHVLFQVAQTGEWMIVDGQQGVIILNPSDLILQEYRERLKRWLSERKKRKVLKRAETITMDGQKVKLFANIELPVDVDDVKHIRADGVGLFRSEFLFLGRDHLPGEEEQYQAYRYVLSHLSPKPVTIRTLDLGADKHPRWQHRGRADNPSLGLTGIRLCLSEPLLFRTQLRALWRASIVGSPRILFPMIQSIEELLQAIHQVYLARQELLDEGYVDLEESIPMGMMVEIPAAAIMIDQFLPYVDFVAIGTNDLIQYTLAVDRNDDSVSHLYDPQHPAVLSLIEHTISRAQHFGKDVSLCGEMAGDLRLTELLLRYGLRDFSMHPNGILDVKEKIRSIDLGLNTGNDFDG
jgi:phosphotransferase system enzyme I (PtsI)